MSLELSERVSRLEVRADNHEKQLNAQIEKNETLTRLVTLMEYNVRQEHARQEQIEKFSEVLEKVNENLSQLNQTQKQMQSDIAQISSRVEKVEERQKSEQEHTTINLSGFTKKAIFWIVSVGLGALSIYIYIKLGLK